MDTKLDHCHNKFLSTLIYDRFLLFYIYSRWSMYDGFGLNQRHGCWVGKDSTEHIYIYTYITKIQIDPNRFNYCMKLTFFRPAPCYREQQVASSKLEVSKAHKTLEQSMGASQLARSLLGHVCLKGARRSKGVHKHENDTVLIMSSKIMSLTHQCICPSCKRESVHIIIHNPHLFLSF